MPFESCDEVLYNDSAVVFPTEADENPEPQTISTALKYGWAWKIPLTSTLRQRLRLQLEIRR